MKESNFFHKKRTGQVDMSDAVGSFYRKIKAYSFAQTYKTYRLIAARVAQATSKYVCNK